ncbi:MAG: rhodanese-like domain-containing protein [Lachnospiraceae bacterium]|nr:rhodanese-like domain-containing protein [Lachnospiraceae bacterium]
MRKILSLMVLVVLIMGLEGCRSEDYSLGYVQITGEEAMTMMAEQEDYVILDVRTPEEFAEKHIVGAVNIPNEEIDEAPIEMLPDLDQLILVYCRSGNRSKQASEKLVKLGYTNVYEFGGIIDWTGDVE